MKATDTFDKYKFPVINEGEKLLVTGKVPEQIVFDSFLYEKSDVTVIREGVEPLSLEKTKKLIVYTVFSPTDYRFQMVQLQTGEETYKQVPAFVSKMMKKTSNEEEYDAINCFFYGEVSYRNWPLIKYNGEELIHSKFIGQNGHQFFFPKE